MSHVGLVVEIGLCINSGHGIEAGLRLEGGLDAGVGHGEVVSELGAAALLELMGKGEVLLLRVCLLSSVHVQAGDPVALTSRRCLFRASWLLKSRVHTAQWMWVPSVSIAMRLCPISSSKLGNLLLQTLQKTAS
ncbi:C2H2 type zinc finger containing protein [Colletotrichum scovillei]|uniref:C2H2 type zinc finger containing protein n=1 Tax=Colletotrichum scovillei TaxID=1209932 RepID=A0A9P7UIC3_9PEZI|nr:C2H2 type zinc finger containing protein [Colletotrichum scovillei]KAG7076209.1 C2H2 type zinc finger containing protein [Colletotrichum scovillei]KAG7083204.1 C2H2 type zinc finger containing protein [Colletotrichum scovillei]